MEIGNVELSQTCLILQEAAANTVLGSHFRFITVKDLRIMHKTRRLTGSAGTTHVYPLGTRYHGWNRVSNSPADGNVSGHENVVFQLYHLVWVAEVGEPLQLLFHLIGFNPFLYWPILVLSGFKSYFCGDIYLKGPLGY